MIDEEVVHVQLGFYLKRLKVAEIRKHPNSRRDVPTVSELALAIGVSPNRLFRLIHGRTRSLNFDLAADIMKEMWQRGFDTDISDILRVSRPKKIKNARDVTDDTSWPPPPLTRRQRLKYPGEEFVKVYAESESTPEEEAAKVTPEGKAATFAPEGTGVGS